MASRWGSRHTSAAGAGKLCLLMMNPTSERNPTPPAGSPRMALSPLLRQMRGAGSRRHPLRAWRSPEALPAALLLAFRRDASWRLIFPTIKPGKLWNPPFASWKMGCRCVPEPGLELKMKTVVYRPVGGYGPSRRAAGKASRPAVVSAPSSATRQNGRWRCPRVRY